MSYYGFRPYVRVADRRARALRKMAALRKKGLDVQPVEAFRTRGTGSRIILFSFPAACGKG